MARIRTIKPEICTSEQVVECSTTARLLWVLMWLFCDDNGIHPVGVKRLKMEVFPADPFTDDQVSGWIEELVSAGLIETYSVSGKEFWRITGWHHQRIEKPNYRYPNPHGIAERYESGRGEIDDQSATFPVGNRNRTGTGQGSGQGSGTGGGTGTGGEGKGSSDQPHPRSDPGQRSHARATKSALTLSDLENAWGEKSLAIVERVEEIFAKAGYSGADGKVFWEAAILEVTSKIRPVFVDSALRACELKAQENPPAYFRKVLVDECTKGGKDFGELARLVRFPAGMKFGPPPRAAPADPVAQFASASKLPDDVAQGASKARQRDEARRT